MGVVFLGAGGRLGRLLKPRWRGDALWATRTEVDLNNQQSLHVALGDATTVFCLAGVTHGAEARMHQNATLAAKVLDAAWQQGGRRVFLFSSAAVYGASRGRNSVAGQTSPLSAYGRAKLEMEDVAKDHPNPCVCLRLGNVAGADAILGGWKEGFELDSFTDGTTPRRSYIGPGCLADVLSMLAQAPDLPDVMNVSAPHPVAMGDLLDAAQLRWQRRPATDATIADVTLDTHALEQIVAFRPEDSTATGIVGDWRGCRTS
ncbi:MAG: NAD-dependent epimerase/dehydratase family protein [Tateyamaria sp.]